MPFNINSLSIYRDGKKAEGQSPPQLHPYFKKRWTPPWKDKLPQRQHLLATILCHIWIALIQKSGTCRMKTLSAILLGGSNLNRLTQEATPLHKLWTNWLKCWNLVKVFKKDPTKPNIALRSEQKTCGLFDKDHAGNSTLDVVSAMPGTDLLIYDEDMDKLEEIKQVGNLISEMDAADLEEVRGLLDVNFLDSLTDVSQFASEKIEENIEVVNIELPIPDETETTNKRLFEEVIGMTCDSTLVTTDLPDHEMTCDSTQVMTDLPDHDYVSKRCKVEVTSSSCYNKVSKNTCPEDKYRERRRKNNIASRRSREQRKTKFQLMDIEADKLIVENERMRLQIVELEKLAAEMKQTLITKIAGK